MHKTLKAEDTEETLTPFIKRLKILTQFDEHVAIYQARLSNKATTDIKTSIPNLYFKQSYTIVFLMILAFVCIKLFSILISKSNMKQAELGLPHSEIQVELD